MIERDLDGSNLSCREPYFPLMKLRILVCLSIEMNIRRMMEERQMHACMGWRGLRMREKDSIVVHWSVIMFETIPPSFFCRSVVAIVMQGALFDRGGWDG